jgi:hypothetical protein
MRKRFVLLLRVVVETYGSSLINDRIADTVAWAVSAPQLAFYIRYEESNTPHHQQAVLCIAVRVFK